MERDRIHSERKTSFMKNRHSVRCQSNPRNHQTENREAKNFSNKFGVKEGKVKIRNQMFCLYYRMHATSLCFSPITHTHSLTH